jgi:hypothetical protein
MGFAQRTKDDDEDQPGQGRKLDGADLEVKFVG